MGAKEKIIGIVLIAFAILSLFNSFGVLAFLGDAAKAATIFLCGIVALLGVLFFTDVL